MSSQSTSPAPVARALPKAHHANLLQILRRANRHYARVAHDFRMSLRPTHHARKRAEKLRLKVSINAALGLDPKQISVIPLPVLATPLPVASRAYQTAASARCAGPRLPVPSQAVVGREREIARLVRPSRPVLRCDIPQEVHSNGADALDSCVSIALDTPPSASRAARNTAMVLSNLATIIAPRALRAPTVPTSRWSMTSDIGSVDITLADATEDDNGKVVYSSDYEEGMMDVEEASPVITKPQIAAVAAGRVIFVPDSRRNKVEADATSRRHPTIRLDAPMDVSDRRSWASDSSVSGSASGSDSALSSSGPVTPVEEMPKLTIRIKRKSSASFIDMDDSDCSFEKRPKYERKRWVNPATRRVVNYRGNSSSGIGSPF